MIDPQQGQDNCPYCGGDESQCDYDFTTDTCNQIGRVNMSSTEGTAKMAESQSLGARRVRESFNVSIGGVHLFRIGDRVIVSVAVDGGWREVIDVDVNGAFSHIVEPSGIRAASESGLERGGK